MKNVIRVDCWISLTGGVAWTNSFASGGLKCKLGALCF